MRNTEEPRGAGDRVGWDLAPGLASFRDRCLGSPVCGDQCRRHTAARVKSSCTLANRMFSATFSSSPDIFSTPPASLRAEGDSAAQTLGFSGMMGHQGGAGRISLFPLPPTPSPAYPPIHTCTHMHTHIHTHMSSLH